MKFFIYTFIHFVKDFLFFFIIVIGFILFIITSNYLRNFIRIVLSILFVFFIIRYGGIIVIFKIYFLLSGLIPPSITYLITINFIVFLFLIRRIVWNEDSLRLEQLIRAWQIATILK